MFFAKNDNDGIQRVFSTSTLYYSATTILTEATLVDQPEKTELEYRVIAVNKFGDRVSVYTKYCIAELDIS